MSSIVVKHDILEFNKIIQHEIEYEIEDSNATQNISIRISIASWLPL